MVAAALVNGTNGSAWSKVTTGLESFFEYLPMVFLLEEVWFRGVLDSHLYHSVSALWGIWHYPIAGPQPSIISLLVVHIAIGTLLSRAWRRSGNLLVPGTS